MALHQHIPTQTICNSAQNSQSSDFPNCVILSPFSFCSFLSILLCTCMGRCLIVLHCGVLYAWHIFIRAISPSNSLNTKQCGLGVRNSGLQRSFCLWKLTELGWIWGRKHPSREKQVPLSWCSSYIGCSPGEPCSAERGLRWKPDFCWQSCWLSHMCHSAINVSDKEAPWVKSKLLTQSMQDSFLQNKIEWEGFVSKHLAFALANTHAAASDFWPSPSKSKAAPHIWGLYAKLNSTSVLDAQQVLPVPPLNSTTASWSSHRLGRASLSWYNSRYASKSHD